MDRVVGTGGVGFSSAISGRVRTDEASVDRIMSDIHTREGTQRDFEVLEHAMSSAELRSHFIE